MKLKHTVQLAYHGVAAKPSRTTLTLTGIAIGIAAVMMIMSMGEGAQRLILSEIEGFGAEMIVIRPGKEPTGLSDISESLLTETLVASDIEALKRTENVPHLESVAPQVLVPGSATFEGESYRPMIVGGDAELLAEFGNFYPEVGRLFDEGDIRESASVAVIGSQVEEELFGEQSALGERITISGRKFQVIGVFPEKGFGSLFDYDKLVIIPYTTAQTYLLGSDHFHEVVVRIDDSAYVARSVRDIEATLRETHNLEPGDEADFNITTQQGTIEQISSIIDALTIFLTGVVAVALVVGGVGIMNIMLVSVTERTREIGLRKAIGATERDILLQFMVEAVLLTLSGGIIGVILGGLLSFLTAELIVRFSSLSWEFVLPMGAVVLALSVSSCIGVVFGLYPARKAARKSPIEALRYE